jgi:transcriptional regulator with XRE-family HTH domain
MLFTQQEKQMIGENLRMIRVVYKWTQADLCTRMGLSRPMVIDVESQAKEVSDTFITSLFTVLLFSDYDPSKEKILKQLVPRFDTIVRFQKQNQLILI